MNRCSENKINDCSKIYRSDRYSCRSGRMIVRARDFCK